MERIQEDSNIKDNNIEPPELYPGAALAKTKLESGKYCWTMSPEQYAKAAVTNVEEDLSRSGNIFPSKCVTSLLSNYATCMEDSMELMSDSMQRY